MIQFEILEIATINDFNILNSKLNAIFVNASHHKLIEDLKSRIGTACKSLIIEYPYRDYDFSSVYSSFYVKKYREVSRDCVRIHLFSNNELSQEFYKGFIVVRDSIIDSRGRALLDPKFLIQQRKAYIVRTEMKANIAGTPFVIDTFPWMAQDTDIAICAHIAIWSIVNYYANRYPFYKMSSIGQISEATPQYLGRKTPSEGLNLLQISDLLSLNGFHPLIIAKRSLVDIDFFRAVYAYIESGIPLVSAMTKKEHAVAIIGHGEINEEGILQSTELIISVADHVNEYIISDDNELPFTMIEKDGSSYTFNDLDHVIVPLYEKMYLNASIVYTRVTGLLESQVLNIEEHCVLRVYLTSVRSLKREVANNGSMNVDLKNILLTLPLPQFVWCADICTKDEYSSGLTSARIIIDSTAGTYENDPWLLMHDGQKIIFRDGQNNNQLDVVIDAYDMYINNLKEV